VRSESHCALRLWYVDLVVSVEVAVEVCCCVLLIEEHFFLVEYVFREGSRYTDPVQEQFAEKFPETPVPHHSAIRRLIEKFRETGSVLDAE
jgi:hypothetical protein